MFVFAIETCGKTVAFTKEADRIGVGCDAEVLSLIRPRFGSEISLGVGDEPIPLSDLLSPIPKNEGLKALHGRTPSVRRSPARCIAGEPH